MKRTYEFNISSPLLDFEIRESREIDTTNPIDTILDEISRQAAKDFLKQQPELSEIITSKDFYESLTITVTRGVLH